MRVLFYGQIPKELAYPEANEDALALDVELGRAALSDGASESFDSQTWARLLVKKFIGDPHFCPNWLSDSIANCLSCYDIANLSWSKQASFERGSFSTLLGVDCSSSPYEIDIISVGDSLAVLLDGYEFLFSYPYTKPEDFLQKPQLLCTNASHNAFVFDADFFLKHSKTWSLRNNKTPTLLCMTDAMGEWALKNASEGIPKWQELVSITDISQLKSIVISEREGKRMRVDDVTLLVIQFDGVRNDELPHP